MAASPTGFSSSSEYVQSKAPPASEFLNLKIGHPSPSSIPISAIRQATEAMLSRTADDPFYYMYGVGQGYLSFRKELASFLTKIYGREVSADSLMITNGSSGGLDLVCKLYSSNGDIVLTEDPTYFLVKHVFSDYGLSVRTVPFHFGKHTDSCGGAGGPTAAENGGGKEERGVDLEELERVVKKVRPKLFYTVPVGHNPSGLTTSAEVRKKVVELAHRYDFYVVADEVYHLLSFPGTSVPPPYAMFDQPGNSRVISLNSFSKILSPSLRLGWIQSGEDIIGKLSSAGMILSGGGLNPFVSGIAHDCIRLELLSKAVEENRSLLSSKADGMQAAMREFFPAEVRWCSPEAGYFVMAVLPEWLTARELLEECEKQKIGFLPGDEFGSNSCNRCVRLSFSYYSVEEIRAGIVGIGKALENLRILKGKSSLS